MRALPKTSMALALVASMLVSGTVAGKRRKPTLDMDPELRQRIRETLEEALASRDALAQGRALYALVDLGDTKARQRAQDALAEENWAIRRYALLITGREADKAFFPVMLRSLENPTTRPHAFVLAEMLPEKVWLEVMKQAVKSPDGGLRQEVLRRMVDRGDDRAMAVIAEAMGTDKRPGPHRDEVLAILPKLTSKAGVAYLMKLTGSKDPAVRRHAQEALLASKDPQVTPFLERLLDRSKDLRLKVEAARALATRGVREGVLPVLKKALDERDVELRVLAMEGIAALGDRVVAQELRPLAVNHREDKRISTAALHVLGGTGDISNLATLREALGKDYIHLRVAAVEAMGELRRKEAIVDLARALTDGNEEVRAAAAVALGKIGGAEIVPPLRQAADRETSPRVRRLIIEALGRSGVQDGFMALQTLLVDPDPEVKRAAVEAILEIGDPKAANSLLVVVDPRFPKVMEAAIRAICLLDPSLGMVALKPYLRQVSLQLVHDLHNEAGPKGVEFLEAFLQDGTQEQRSLALDLLLRRGAKGLAVVREAAKSNDDKTIRRAAMRALMALNDRGSMDTFVAGCEDPDEGIRGIAAEALGLLGAKEHRDALLKLLEDRSPSVRVAAAHALVRLAMPTPKK